jgi:hypothetical protein
MAQKQYTPVSIFNDCETSKLVSLANAVGSCSMWVDGIMKGLLRFVRTI